ncbi:hypothetical protein [Dongshaea marina]|uniref:hypothetical protein n=1 Tax=Dongshaea marina TaxID=2047966 RepID=UPI000D3E9E16|nr:hypothetical protein [Dongshaea marina]
MDPKTGLLGNIEVSVQEYSDFVKRKRAALEQLEQSLWNHPMSRARVHTHRQPHSQLKNSPGDLL